MSQDENKLEPKWYVVHTYSGYENKVKTDLEKTIKNRELEEFFFNIVVPMEEQVEIKDGKRKTNLKKVFPGYVLVKMVLSDETWYIVRNIRGCAGFVGSSAKPIPLTPEEVRKLGVERREVRLSYNVGEAVRILEGPLANMVGKVAEINIDTKTVKVIVSMFGRETPAELTLGQIESIM